MGRPRVGDGRQNLPTLKCKITCNRADALVLYVPQSVNEFQPIPAPTLTRQDGQDSSTMGTADIAIASPEKQQAGKHRRRLGVPALTFMVIAASAPLTVLAGGVTTTLAVTAVIGIPLSYLLLALALGVFSVGYAAMSRYITNAGAFYAYIAQGISRPLGVGASIVALVSYNGMQIGLYGMFGFTVASLVNTKLGLAIPWWSPVFACISIVGLLGINRIDLSARVLGVLVGFEFIIVILYDCVAFHAAPEGISVAPLQPASLLVNGMGAAFAFGIAAFMGFESAAIYGEESRDPEQTVARATYTAVAIIGLFYAVSAWAMTLSTGPGRIVAVVQKLGADLIFNFIGLHMGTFVGSIAQLLFVTSLFASLVSFHNAVARYFFSLGRESVLPEVLSRVRKSSGSPYIGSFAQTAIAVAVVSAFAVAGTSSGMGTMFPVLTLFCWLTNAGAMGLVLLMALVSIAVIGYFGKQRRRPGLWTRVFAPILSFVALGTIFILILTNFDVLLAQKESNAVTWILPAIVIVPGIIGVFRGCYLKKNRFEIYRQIGQRPGAGETLGSGMHF